MNALQTLALAKATEKAAKSIKLTPGIHNVNMIVQVHVKGTIEKKADTEKTPTVSIPLKATLALALQKAGIQRENIARILTEAMTEALNMGEQGEAKIAQELADVDAAMERVTAITATLPKTPVSGATNCKLTAEVEILEPELV